MIKLELSREMLVVIGQALENAPYRVAAPVLNEIQKQLEAQQGNAPGGTTVSVDEPEKAAA